MPEAITHFIELTLNGKEPPHYLLLVAAANTTFPSCPNNAAEI